jgi:hypothetical protein
LHQVTYFTIFSTFALLYSFSLSDRQLRFATENLS